MLQSEILYIHLEEEEESRELEHPVLNAVNHDNL